MSGYWDCTLTVTGAERELAALVERIHSGWSEGAIKPRTLESLLPVPPMLHEDAAHDWKGLHWGTPTGDCRTCGPNRSPGLMSWYFDAGLPPEPAIAALAALHPALRWDLYSVDGYLDDSRHQWTWEHGVLVK